MDIAEPNQFVQAEVEKYQGLTRQVLLRVCAASNPTDLARAAVRLPVPATFIRSHPEVMAASERLNQAIEARAGEFLALQIEACRFFLEDGDVPRLQEALQYLRNTMSAVCCCAPIQTRSALKALNNIKHCCSITPHGEIQSILKRVCGPEVACE